MTESIASSITVSDEEEEDEEEKELRKELATLNVVEDGKKRPGSSRVSSSRSNHPQVGVLNLWILEDLI